MADPAMSVQEAVDLPADASEVQRLAAILILQRHARALRSEAAACDEKVTRIMRSMPNTYINPPAQSA